MRIVFLIPLLFIIAVNASGQETVYRTVNEQGVVSFSDTPPAGDEAVEKVQIDVATPQAPDEYLERLEAMRETTDRMAQDRREREQHRASLRQAGTVQQIGRAHV